MDNHDIDYLLFQKFINENNIMILKISLFAFFVGMTYAGNSKLLTCRVDYFWKPKIIIKIFVIH